MSPDNQDHQPITRRHIQTDLQTPADAAPPDNWPSGGKISQPTGIAARQHMLHSDRMPEALPRAATADVLTRGPPGLGLDEEEAAPKLQAAAHSQFWPSQKGNSASGMEVRHEASLNAGLDILSDELRESQRRAAPSSQQHLVPKNAAVTKASPPPAEQSHCLRKRRLPREAQLEARDQAAFQQEAANLSQQKKLPAASMTENVDMELALGKGKRDPQVKPRSALLLAILSSPSASDEPPPGMTGVLTLILYQGSYSRESLTQVF